MDPGRILPNPRPLPERTQAMPSPQASVRILTAAILAPLCWTSRAAAMTPPEQITGDSMNHWLILYNADSSGLDENTNGINDSVEWKDWFISTHGISQPRTLGLTDPDGTWNKEWAGMQEDFASSNGLWTQVHDYLDTGTNGDEVIGILVGYNVPGIWDVYSRDPAGLPISFRRGAKSVASALSRMGQVPPAKGRSYANNPIVVPTDLNFWVCGRVFPWPQLPSTGNLTKALLEAHSIDRLFITARIDGPSLEDAKDLTRRALAITNGDVTVGPDELMWQDYIDDRENLPYWPELATAVVAAHRDLRWGKFMYDGIIDYDSNGGKECDTLPCPPEVYPTHDLGWFGYEYNNFWAEDINGDWIQDKTFRVLCQQPVGTRLFACAWISWGGVTLRYRSTDPRPVLAFSDNPPINPDYLTTNGLAPCLDGDPNTACWIHSQFSFNALWPDCDGDGTIDPVGGFASIVASPTCEQGTVGSLNPSVFLDRIRNGATLAEASLIASPRLQWVYEYVGDPFLKLPRPLPTDCNANGIDDYQEILAGSATDANGDGILDECGADCDADGINDVCAIARNATTDCNYNAVPDLCDVCSGASTDCDFDMVPDECDLAAGSTTDLNTNGLPDSCEDCNTNGIPDFLPGDCPVFDDYDRDGDTDLFDFAAFQRCFGPDPDEACGCAFDYGLTYDDIIDLADFQQFSDHLLDAGGPTHQCWVAIQQARYANICPAPAP